jgi:hypothetical protein
MSYTRDHEMVALIQYAVRSVNGVIILHYQNMMFNLGRFVDLSII